MNLLDVMSNTQESWVGCSSPYLIDTQYVFESRMGRDEKREGEFSKLGKGLVIINLDD